VKEINKTSTDANGGSGSDREKYVIPPHLHDLQEADLPETQRGLVISEIAQFRERAARREREKVREVRDAMPVLAPPSGPKQREWGRPQHGNGQEVQGRAVGAGPQSYDKPVGFVPAGEERQLAGKGQKTDEELEAERKEARRKDEESSFRDVRRRLFDLTGRLKLPSSSENGDMSLVSARGFKGWSALLLEYVL
jgi:RNA-binding protein 25